MLKSFEIFQYQEYLVVQIPYTGTSVTSISLIQRDI